MDKQKITSVRDLLKILAKQFQEEQNTECTLNQFLESIYSLKSDLVELLVTKFPDYEWMIRPQMELKSDLLDYIRRASSEDIIQLGKALLNKTLTDPLLNSEKLLCANFTSSTASIYTLTFLAESEHFQTLLDSLSEQERNSFYNRLQEASADKEFSSKSETNNCIGKINVWNRNNRIPLFESTSSTAEKTHKSNPLPELLSNWDTNNTSEQKISIIVNLMQSVDKNQKPVLLKEFLKNVALSEEESIELFKKLSEGPFSKMQLTLRGIFAATSPFYKSLPNVQINDIRDTAYKISRSISGEITRNKEINFLDYENDILILLLYFGSITNIFNSFYNKSSVEVRNNVRNLFENYVEQFEKVIDLGLQPEAFKAQLVLV
jgi:hypothetical protein